MTINSLTLYKRFYWIYYWTKLECYLTTIKLNMNFRDVNLFCMLYIID